MLTFCDPVLAMIRSCSQFIAARSDYLQLIEQGGGSRKRTFLRGDSGDANILTFAHMLSEENYGRLF
jgi:hypothetical protein